MHSVVVVENWNDPEFVLKKVEEGNYYDFPPLFLENASDELKNNKEFMLKIVKLNGYCLQYASERLKDDDEFVLEAVKKDSRSLRYTSERLKDDRGIVLEAVKQNGFSLQFASERLKNVKEVILEAVKQHGRALAHASEKFRDDKEIVLEAVKKSGDSLFFASERLKDDKEIVLEAVKQFAPSAGYGSERLKDDKDIVIEEVKANGYKLRTISENFKNDKDVVLEAVKQDCSNLRYAGERVFDDKDVVLEAVKRNSSWLKLASEKLRNDKELILEVIKNASGCFLRYVGKKMKSNHEIVLAALKNERKKTVDREALFYANPNLLDNKEFFHEVIKLDSTLIQFASEKLKNDEKFFSCAIFEHNLSPKYDRCFLLQFANERMKNDKDFFHKMVVINGNILEFGSDEIKNDRLIVIAAVLQDVSSLRHASEELKSSSEFMMKIISIFYSSAIPRGPILKFMNEEMRNNKDIVAYVIYYDGSSLEYASDRLKNDKITVIQAIKENGSAICLAGENIKNDRNFVLELLKDTSSSLAFGKQPTNFLEYLNEDMRNDPNFVLQCMQLQFDSILHFDEKFRKDISFMLKAIKINPKSIWFVEERLQDDLEFLVSAFQANKKVLHYMYTQKEILNTEEFIRKICRLDISNLEYASEELKKSEEFVGRLKLEFSEMNRNLIINRVDKAIEIVDQARIYESNPSREYREKKLVDFDHKINDKEFYDKGLENEFQLIGNLRDQNICRFFETVVYCGNDRTKDRVLDEFLKLFEGESEECENEECLEGCEHWKLRWSKCKEKMDRSFGEDLEEAENLVKELMRKIFIFLPIRDDVWEKARREAEEKINRERFNNENEKERRRWFLFSQCFDRYILEYKIRKDRNCINLGEFKEIGVAYCRHLSILFKIVCDIIGIRCRLVRGWVGIDERNHHQWNIVMLGHRLFMIDCMNQKMTENFQAKDYFNLSGKLRRSLEKEVIKITNVEEQFLQTKDNLTRKEGGFSTIYFMNLEGSNEKFAIKEFDFFKLRTEKGEGIDWMKYVNREIKYLRCLCHPNIMDMTGVFSREEFEGEEFYYIAMRSLNSNGNDLIRKLNRIRGENKEKLQQIECLIFLLLTANGISYLHEMEIVHCDLKPGNILVEYDDENTQVKEVRIIDFCGSKDKAESCRTTNLMLTPKYSDPTLIKLVSPNSSAKGFKLHPKHDVYSFGKIIADFSRYLDPKIKENLKKRCLDAELNNRPSMNQIIQELRNHLIELLEYTGFRYQFNEKNEVITKCTDHSRFYGHYKILEGKGNGICFYRNGDIYEGGFRSGFFDGQGIFYKNGEKIYEGLFKEGLTENGEKLYNRPEERRRNSNGNNNDEDESEGESDEEN